MLIFNFSFIFTTELLSITENSSSMAWLELIPLNIMKNTSDVKNV